MSELAYLVCATQRSGSTLLCRALAATGVAGRPEEYFEARAATGAPAVPRDYGLDLDGSGPPAPWYSSLVGVADYADHLRRTLEHGTTPNGVFGAKVMWSHLSDLATLAGSTPPQVFHDVLGRPPLYVRVSRRDRLRQAISLWRALQTQAWSGKSDADVEPVYSFQAVDHLRRRLDADERGWDTFFGDHGIEPLAFDYDQVASDLRASVRKALGYLGLDPARADDVSPPLERQADERSAEWVLQYQRDSNEVIA